MHSAIAQRVLAVCMVTVAQVEQTGTCTQGLKVTSSKILIHYAIMRTYCVLGLIL